MNIVSFFYILRAHGIKVTPKEWMDLYVLLKKGRIRTIPGLYSSGRTVLVKSEKLYDAYDRAFADFLTRQGDTKDIIDAIVREMEDAAGNDRRSADNTDIDELIQRLKALLDQHGRHRGGDHFIGQNGSSPFGSSGAEKKGVRLGGERVHDMAWYVAGRRAFQNLREDVSLSRRNIGIALKKLRHFQKTGRELEVDIERTVDATAQNFGDIDIIFSPERKNSIKILMLMDVGGSMEPYRERVEALFATAKHLRYFKAFTSLYFHNCIYDFIYTDIKKEKRISTQRIFREFSSEWKLIIIGDACMSPYELYNSYEKIYDLGRKGRPGHDWLKAVQRHFKSAVWLNPSPPIQWQHQTVKAVSRLFPMFALSPEGIENTVRELLTVH